jgi:hypothetical protein
MGRRAVFLIVVGIVTACSPGGAAETSGTTTIGEASSEGPGGGESTLAPTTGVHGASSSTGMMATGSSGSSSGDAGTSSSGDAGTSSSGDAETSSSGDAETSTGEPVPLLRVEPAVVQVVVAGGWSVPAQFSAVLDDGANTPVVAAWSVDDPSLGRITEFGGTFAARDVTGGVVQVSAEYDGQVAVAEVEVVIVDDHPVCPPRPPLTVGEPAPGAFIKVVAPEYEGTGVYHGVYLPPGWTPGRRYPVIVESPCNKYGQFLGKVDDTRMGYHWSGCRDYVWIVVPYIKDQANLDYGWGDVAATLEYWKVNVPRTIAAVGGDPGAVVVTGFSRGAIGTGWMGLQDDEIADAWLGFYMHSHADAPGGLTPDGGAGAMVRMARTRGRASLLSWGAAGDGGMVNSTKGADLLTSLGYPVETFAVPGVGHTEAWIVDDAASREVVQSWLFATVAARPGTGSVYGRVVDGMGAGVAGVRVEAGPMHWDTTDAAGYYGLRGLVHGLHAVTCAAPGCGAAQMVDVAEADVEGVEFLSP